MKKKVFDITAPEFDYAEAKTIQKEAFEAVLGMDELHAYPRPVLLAFEFSCEKPKKDTVEKLVDMAVREFGSLIYYEDNNRIISVTPFGSAKAENATKVRRMVSSFGAIESKKTVSVRIVMAYVTKENAASLLPTCLEKLEQKKDLLIVDETFIDPSDATFLCSKELSELSFDLAYSLGFQSTGFGRIIGQRNRVELLSTSGKASFSRLGNAFSLERLLPFVSISEGDDYFFVSDSRNLPPKPMAILDSIGLISFAVRFFKEKGKLIGFAFAGSSRNIGYMKGEGKQLLERFFQIEEKRFFLAALDKQKEDAKQDAIDLSTYADNALLRVDKRGNIVYMSPNLADAYASREARINDKASKPFPEIFGKKMPSHGETVLLTQLGSGHYYFYPLRVDSEGTKTYLFTRLDETQGSRRKERNTDIYTRYSYDSLLQDELLARRDGSLLYIRLSNAAMAAGKVKPEGTVEEVMNHFIAYLVEKGFGYDLYRYDENTLVYVLPRVAKESVKSLALSLATLVAKITKLGRFPVKPEVDYLLLSYPIEVAYTTDADSFVRALFGKADDFGHGRLCELNKERGRLLLPPLYEEEAVKKAMVAMEVPFRLTPIKDIGTNQIAYIHLDFNIHGEDGDEILPPNVLAAARRTNLLVKMLGIANEKLAISYLDDAKTMKLLGYRGIMFHVPMELLIQDAFYNNFLKALPNNREYLYLRVGESEINQRSIARLDQLRKEGFKLALEDYRHEVPYEFDGYLTALFDLTGGAGEAGASFLALCQKKARAGKVVAVGFVDDPQAIAFLNSSHLSYAMGQAAGKAMDEKDFLTGIRNKRKAKSKE